MTRARVASPIVAIALGALIALRSSALDARGAAVAYAPSFVAWMIGVSLDRAWPTRPLGARWLAWLGVAAIATSFIFSGALGVHRWLELGPIRLPAPAAFGPLVLVGLTGSDDRPSLEGLFTVLVAQSLHALQPDGAQSMALACAALPLLARRGARANVTAAALVVLAVVAWRRPDPLPPLAHVEGTWLRAAALGPAWLASALGSIAFLVLTLVRSSATTRHALAAAGWLVGASVASTLGAFPVPLLGAGAAPVLGFFVLAQVMGRQSQPISPPLSSTKRSSDT